MEYTLAERKKYYKNLPRKHSSVAVLVLDEKKRILLVKANYRNYWTFPGGVVGEMESPIQTGVRETKEETNLDVKIESLLAIRYYKKDIGGDKYDSYQFFVLGRICGNCELKIDSKEITGYRWVDFDSAFKLLSSNWQRNLREAWRGLEARKTIYFEENY